MSRITGVRAGRAGTGDIDPMKEATQILNAIEGGDPLASEKLLPLVYTELRRLAAARMAKESPGQTLSATALVHEAFLRLVDAGESRRWDSRGHFFAAAAEAMRRILLNRARDKRRLKRGGGRRRIDLERVDVASECSGTELLILNDALEKLEEEDPPSARLVKLRFFAGLPQGEAAMALGVSRRTADRYWSFARAWLHDALEAGEDA